MTRKLRMSLIRHGTTDANEQGLFLGQTDVPLNRAGQREVAALAARLSGVAFDAVVASDLRRATETARAIAGAQRPPSQIIVEPRLREMHLGDYEGVPARHVHATDPDLVERWAADPTDVRMPGPDAESLRDVQVRVWEAVEDLVQAHPTGRIAVIGHTFAMLTILCRVLHLPLSRFRALHLDRASLSQLDWRRHGPVVTLLNDTSHLAGVP